MTETLFTNGRLVLADTVLAASLVLRDGAIADIQPGPSALPAAIDLEGDFLLPGAIDLHTDNLERQVSPRSTARWPSRSAMMIHDAQCAAAGVTTVLDALCVGDVAKSQNRIRTFHDAVVDLDALAPTGMLKSEHFLHLRCELPAAEMQSLFAPVAAHPRVRMVSLMDHSPGVGQYTDVEQFRAMRRHEGHGADWIDRRIAELGALRARWREPNRRAVLDALHSSGIALASHDDRDIAEVEQNYADGIRISEFPVTLAAAQSARALGMGIIAGAPNIVRGGSHFGNVNAAELLQHGTIDAFASDYVPASLIEAAFLCAAAHATPLPQAVALISARAAAMAGLTDRGRLAPGMRADLVRVRLLDNLPVIRAVWRAGERVA